MFRNFLLLTTAPIYSPPGLCFSDAGSAGGDAGAGGGGGGGSPPPADFLTLVPEDIRGEAYFKDIKDVSTLATKAFHQAKLIGVPPDQVIKLAGPDDTEAWNGIWNRLGRPEAADKYQLADPKPEDVPAGMTVSPEAKAAFAGKAHELGLNQKQADGLYGWINGTRMASAKDADAAAHTALQNVERQLRGEFGAGFDEAQERTNLVLDRLDSSLNLNGGLKAAFAAIPPEGRAASFKALAKIGEMFQEHGIIGKGGGGSSANLSPAEARQQIDAMWADPATKQTLTDKRAPGHQAAVDKHLALHEFLSPQAA